MTESLKKKIAGYSAMAVAVLARSNAADAQVIYTDINPDHEMQGWHSNYFLDLNNDGIDDFKFNFLFVSSSSGGSSWFYDLNFDVIALNNNYVLGNLNYPMPLDSGKKINSNKNFIKSGVLYHHEQEWGNYAAFEQQSGKWTDDSLHFLGLKLEAAGNIYYGGFD